MAFLFCHCHKVGACFHNPLDRIRKFQEVGNFDFTYSPCSSLKAGKENLDLATAVGEEGTGVTTDGALVCPKSPTFSPEASFLYFILGMGSGFWREQWCLSALG